MVYTIIPPIKMVLGGMVYGIAIPTLLCIYIDVVKILVLCRLCIVQIQSVAYMEQNISMMIFLAIDLHL